MIVYDTIRVVVVKIQLFTLFILFYFFYHLKDKHNRGKIQLVSFINTLPFRFTKVDKTNL